MDRLKLVSQRIREAILKLKASTCCLIREWVPFLGHYVMHYGPIEELMP